ncbi:VP2 [Bercke-Baary Melophagus reo-like virus]|nr:VP2 [Bercke-Baary Melophagus reo-like virus]UJG27946.1 VP2 [Bercke-Baary Melophagus reo-like virus]
MKELKNNAVDSEKTLQSNNDESFKNTDDLSRTLQPQTDTSHDNNKRIDFEDKDEHRNNTDMLAQGKNRIIAANDELRKEHDKSEEKDRLAVRQTQLMTVIANHTIAALQTETNTTSLRAAPLSSFAFGKVDRTVQGSYGITPYMITTEVPQLFKFTTLYNESQQVNLPDLMTMKFSMNEVNDTVAQSINIFNISTMTVRIELNDKLGMCPILDPNSIENGAMKLSTVVPAGRENPQTSVNFVENRIFSVVSAFNALDNVLVAIPQKIVVLDSARGGPVAESLVRMPFYKGMHPHPYYSVYSNLPDWARQHFNNAYAENPLQIGDLAVNSYAGMKLAQVTKLVIDQYTSAVLRLNFNKLINHTLTTNILQEKIRASLFEYDKLEVVQLCDLEDFSLLYNYTQDEYNLYMFRLLTDRIMQLKVVNFLNEELTKTNRLTTVPLEDVWKGLLAGDVQAASFNQTWLSSINIGNSFTPYEMLIYETFSDFFNFNLTYSAIPNSLEAVTEIISIYTFMLLYPRITQRVIHQLGYRLTQLYDAMYPGIFNAFRSEFGDVRTNWGTNKFDAYGYQLSRNESQQGYVYSVFVPLNRTRYNDRPRTANLQDLLNQFIQLLNSLRHLVIPTTYQYNLDEKRIAKYPFLYDTFTAYASWKPIRYGDYQISSYTELGDKLRTLVGYANDFKKLFTSQNPDSAQMPRGFNSYYTSWTNQLSRLVSTAGSVYQITYAMIQKTLFNSPFYVGSQYNPEPNKFWFVPRDIGIGPLVSANLSSLVIPTRIQINNFKINVGMCLALTMEGEYLRNTLAPSEGEHDVQQSKDRIRNDITSLDAVECFKMANSLISEARKFGFAMQMTQWLTTPEDNDNPFGHLVFEISQYMKMASWVPLVKKIFSMFGLSFEDMFIRSMGQSEFILDGRYLDRTLVLVDPSTSMAAQDQPVGSKFNVKFNYMVPIDIDKLTILTKPLLSMDSRIIYIHKDWYFGKLVVDEMGPTQTNLATTNWTDETTFNRHFKFSRVGYKNGQAAQLEYLSDFDGQKRSMILPYTASNVPVLLITIEYVMELNLTYLRVLAKAISQGKVILRIKSMKVRVWIEDMPSRTQDYSEPMMSEDEVYDILSLPAGCIIERKFKTTHYASNFASEALVCPGYIQWFATPNPADRNIFASTITNAITQPPQSILPTSDEMGYGPDEDGLTFPNNTLKTESNIINWNNSLPTVSPKLINSVELRIIPYIPQYLGN